LKKKNRAVPMDINRRPAQACLGFSINVLTTKKIVIAMNMAGVKG
jgi:hypothetical protein